MPLALVKPAGTGSSDNQLAQQLAQGDRDALQIMMRRYNQRLYRVARSILCNEADAEEAVQEAFYKAYCSIGSFRGDSALSTCLLRIVVTQLTKPTRKITTHTPW